MTVPNTIDLSHKRVLDTMLLKLPGVEAGEMTGLLAYFVGKRMFACVCNGGVGVRLPAADAANLQFSRDNVGPFEPKGRKSSREWIQINHEDSAEYEKDLEIFRSSIAFVRAAKG
jgi:hypothetical protein